MTAKKESSIESDFSDYVRYLGGRSFKIETGDGMTDRLVTFPRRPPGFIELKADKKKPRKLQDFHIRKLIKAGYLATWADNLEDAKAFADIVKNQEQTPCTKNQT